MKKEGKNIICFQQTFISFYIRNQQYIKVFNCCLQPTKLINYSVTFPIGLLKSNGNFAVKNT